MIDATQLRARRTAASFFPTYQAHKDGLNSKLHAVCDGSGGQLWRRGDSDGYEYCQRHLGGRNSGTPLAGKHATTYPWQSAPDILWATP